MIQKQGRDKYQAKVMWNIERNVEKKQKQLSDLKRQPRNNNEDEDNAKKKQIKT